MANLLRKFVDSISYRSANLLYTIFPKRFVLTAYCYMAYIIRNIAWALACKYYGSGIVRYRGDVGEFVLSQINAGDRVLDVGCGEAYLTRMVAKKALSVTGLEIDQRYVDNIDKSVKEMKNVKFVIGDVRDMGPGETYDAAILVHTIEHLEGSASVIGKLSKFARKIIVETPDQDDWLLKLLNDLNVKALGDDKHYKLYNSALLKKELEQNNWADIVLSRGDGVVRAVARSKLLDSNI